MSLSAEKKAARAAAFAARKAAHGAGLDAAAQAHLSAFLDATGGGGLAGYMPLSTELDPLPVMARWAGAYPVCVPVVTGQGQPLLFRAWHPGARMIKGAFGAEIPLEGAAQTPDIVIVPLVAFDRSGGRLGYGGGFYDRTLERLRAAGPVLALGFAYSAQELDSLPLEPTDQPLDAIVTEAGILRF